MGIGEYLWVGGSTSCIIFIAFYISDFILYFIVWRNWNFLLGKVEAKHVEQNRTEEWNKRREVKAKRVVYLLGKKRKF